MTPEKFNELLDYLKQKIDKIFVEKGNFYGKQDRLGNFKSVGHMNAQKPEEALWGMVSKHIIALRDMIKSDKIYTEAKWIEYAGDVINFMKLLLGIIAEKDAWKFKIKEE